MGEGERGLSVLNRVTIISGKKLHSLSWNGIPFQLDYLLIGPESFSVPRVPKHCTFQFTTRMSFFIVGRSD